MNVQHKLFVGNGNDTLVLSLAVKPQSGSFESPQFVVGGLVVCQFRAEMNLQYINSKYEYRTITLSEKFTLVDKSLYIKPVIRSRFLGVDITGGVRDNMISDDTITMTANIWHHKGTTTVKEYRSEYALKIAITIEDWYLRATPFETLHDDTTIADFELCGQDGSIIVHKAVLAASSPMLNTMLSGQWKEATNGKLELAGVTKETLTDLKVFMYLKTLPSKKEKKEENKEVEEEEEVNKQEKRRKLEKKSEQRNARLEELLKLACYLLMPDLVEACSALLLLGLTTDNAYKLINLAGMYKIKTLSQGLVFSFQQQSMDFTWSSIVPGDWI